LPKPLKEEEKFFKMTEKSNNYLWAALLSFFVCGLGQMIKNQWVKGCYIFFLFYMGLIGLSCVIYRLFPENISVGFSLVLFFFLGLILWICNVIDAYLPLKESLFEKE